MAINSNDVKIETPVENVELKKSNIRSQKHSSIFMKPTEENNEESSDDISCESENITSTLDSIGLWLMSLSSHFGSNVLFSAAHDLVGNNFLVNKHIIADQIHGGKNVTYHKAQYFRRDCNEQSAGNFMLISVVPELVAQILSTLIPFHCMHFRMLFTICLSFIGYIVAASSHSSFYLYLGVLCTSFSTGVAENTFLSYISRFDNTHLILIIFSGNGSAAILGSLWYVYSVAAGFNYSTIMYSLLIMPLLTAFGFWGLLNRPAVCCCKGHVMFADRSSSDELVTIRKNEGVLQYLRTIRDHLYLNVAYIPNLFPFMFSVSAVFFFDFYINTCLFELIYFKDFFLTINGQYRWYQVTYSFATFLVKSSLYFINIDSLWCFPVLQAINASFLTLSTIYYILPHFAFALCFVFWEGLMGTYMYTTILIVLVTHVHPERRRFSMGVVACAETLGATFATLIAEPAHDFICGLPEDLSIYGIK